MKRIAFISLMLFTAPLFGATIESTFDTTDEGWTVNSATSFGWSGDDGNPAGYLRLDNTEQQLAYIFAPVAFRGDLTAYNGGTISFDGKLIGTGGSFYNNTNFDYGSIRLSNGALTATLDLLPAGGTAPTAAWATYTAPLSAASWGKSEGDWLALLANVTELRIGMEALFGNEIQGIDNIRLTAVPAPATVWLLATAVLAMGARLARARRGLAG